MTINMGQEPSSKPDYRLPTAANWAVPRAVADGSGGTIIAVAKIPASPERVYRLTTDEVERWWGHLDYYHQTDWKADLQVRGQWSVVVRFKDGSTNGGSGEFAEISSPHKLVMTRKFEKHPLQGARETTITFASNLCRWNAPDNALGRLHRPKRSRIWKCGTLGTSSRLASCLFQSRDGRRQQMTGQDYSSSITANITADEAAERINRVADWWTSNFTGASRRVGDAFTVRFGETFVDFVVVEVVPARRIVWRVTDCNLHFIADKKEWKDTSVVFEISSNGALTTVTMTHAGLVPGIECYQNCEKGWDFYVKESLQKLLGENQGVPDGRKK